MAFEREVTGRVLLFNVLNRAPSFDAADSETHRICEAAYDPRLIFEGRLHCLVEFVWLIRIYDVDISICSTNDEELILDIKCVDTFLTLKCPDWILLAHVPIFDSLIPGPSHKHVIAINVDESSTSHWLIVNSNLLRIIGLIEIYNFCTVVSAAARTVLSALCTI